MSRSNVRIDYYIDSITLTRHLIVVGADPSHTKDLERLGGLFRYIDKGKYVWVFNVSAEDILQRYIKTGDVKTSSKKKRVKVPNGKLKQTGLCKSCKNMVTLDAAVTNKLRTDSGGLSRDIMPKLMNAEYKQQISAVFEDGTYECINCQLNE